MNLQETLQRMFPLGQVYANRRSFEVNGLPKNTVPQYGDILASGMEPDSRGDRREHYLVRTDGMLMFFRICTAMESSGYAEFVAGREVAVLEEDQVRLEAYARGWIADMTTRS